VLPLNLEGARTGLLRLGLNRKRLADTGPDRSSTKEIAQLEMIDAH
jgi:hypothetical protein